MSWLNSDGLYVKFSKEEADSAQGGEFNSVDGTHSYQFKIDYSDMQSTTPAIVNGGDTTKGPYGVVIPEGLRITEVELLVQTVFTSSGTIADGSIDIGLKQRDRSTELDHDGLVDGYDADNLDSGNAGALLLFKAPANPATTGALVGTTLSQDGVVVACNPAHATVPYTAGVLIVTVRGYFP